MGLKESSSRGTKRRRGDVETGQMEIPSPSLAHPPARPLSSANQAQHPSSTSSPAHSQSVTPAASPAMQHLPRPPTAKPAPTSAKSNSNNLPFPMPTVAANTPSPIIASATTGSDPQRTSYYRPRPNQEPTSKPPSATHHQYMFQPNGGGSSNRGPRHNGK